jgi:hypothetical protein
MTHVRIPAALLLLANAGRSGMTVADSLESGIAARAFTPERGACKIGI